MPYRYERRQKAGLGSVLFVVLLTGIPFALWGITEWRNSINFDVGCGGHLKRAADANTVQLAEQELKIALDYMTANGLTQGTTQILIPSPSKDIGFWYKNVKACYDDLLALPQVERGRTEVVNTSLLKLRQSLLDHTGGGENVTCPSGIANFPNNVGRCVWGWLSFLFWIIIGGGYFIANADIT